MKFARALIAVSFTIFATSVEAQARPELPLFTALGGPILPAPGNALDTAVEVTCPVGPTLTSCSSLRTWTRLSNFATYVELQDLRRGVDRRADDGAALAGATDLMSPANGASNRIGMQAFTIGDSTAVGGSYTRRIGQFDVGAAFATTQDRAAGKVSMGFSW